MSPRKKETVEQKLPPYMTEDGQLLFDKIFQFQEKQTELFRPLSRKGKVYTVAAAPEILAVGGIRSGKTSGWLMFLVFNYCLTYEKCDILVLRRTFKELESGAIADFKAFVPKELYTYNPTNHVATFTNGSRVVFGHCEHNKERDIQQYLGQAYAGILVDECGQFSPDAWMMLQSRNTPNAACQEDSLGNMPIPVIIGCTNPLGPHYEYYRTIFKEKKPWQCPEDAVKDDNGCWWRQEAGDWLLVYDPKEYAYSHTTVLDNAALLKRDPGIIHRLNMMPKAKRDKLLLGLDGPTDGQYFDIFDETYHVINLREDPEAIIWQEYQPVWASQDWGMGHNNAAYLFTKALVRNSVGTDYRLKVVCFKEVVTSGGKTHQEWASILQNMCKLPNGSVVKLKAIYFSHEKFGRVMDSRSPADEYSKSLRAKGLPSVTRGTTDRVGSASLMYNMLKNGELIILDSCRDIIQAIPTLQRDPDMMDDVLKVDSKGDDCYDGFRLGLYGELAARKKPMDQSMREYAETLDPVSRHFYLLKMQAEKMNQNSTFIPSKIPMWQVKSER